VLFDVGSHLFDVCQFVLGPIVAITGFTHHIPRRRVDDRTNLQTDVETDDTAAAWFRHECGARGQWFISRATAPQPNDRWLEVIGPKGSLRASLSRGSVDTLQVCHPCLSDWETVPLPDSASDKKPHALTRMMRSFVDACLLGRPNGDVDASFRDGLAAQRGLHAVSAASDQLLVVKPPEKRKGATASRTECFSESGNYDY
jgi:predicted dehydrogenase